MMRAQLTSSGRLRARFVSAGATIQQCRFESTVTGQDGETALGGLIRASRARTGTGVPGHRAVPLLGAAFHNSNQAARRTELLVFLTPRVMRSSDAANVATADLSHQLQHIRNSRYIQANAPPD